MSYDIEMRMNTGRDEHVVEDIGSPTYNLAEMFAEALGCPIRQLEGLTGAEALPIVSAGVHQMLADPPRFKALNPPNGWGDYAGALETLTKLAEACDRHPAAKVYV